MKTDSKSWENFIYGGRQVTVTWASRYLSLIDDTLTASPLLTEDGSPITSGKRLGMGADHPDPNKQLAAAESGPLPDGRRIRRRMDPGSPSASSAARMRCPTGQMIIDRMLASQLMPVGVGNPIRGDPQQPQGSFYKQAVIQTLTGELTALEAAEQAASETN